MKIIYNNITPFKGVAAINLFGVLFMRNGVVVTERMLIHERIHTAKMKELLYVGFYIWYFVEFVIKWCKYGKDSYRNLSFEKEAYDNDDNFGYLFTRNRFSWWLYL